MVQVAAGIALEVARGIAGKTPLEMPPGTTPRTVPGTVPRATRKASLSAARKWTVTLTCCHIASYEKGSREVKILEQIMLLADIQISEGPQPPSATGPE
jgi:hypothetical protein